MRIPHFLSLLISACLVASSIVPQNERCVTAVYSAYGYIPFAGDPARGYWQMLCRNPLKVTSIYAATQVYCSPSEQEPGLSQLASICQQVAHLDLIPREQLAENLTDKAISEMRVIEYLEIPSTHPVESPVLLSPSYYDRTFRTIDTWQFEMWTHHAYGFASYGFWACILAVGIFHRVFQHIKLWQGVDSGHRLHPLSRTLFMPFHIIYHWIQTHFFVSPPLPSRGRHVLWWTFPTRIEAIVTLLFWIMSTVLCVASYRVFSENIYWPDISAQILRYAADRTGIISFANLPLVWLFAGRNNIFIWATGWSFATFNLFHRHIAWIATIQAAVHTALYLVLFIQNGNAWRKLQKPYLFWGTIAMIMMLWLLPSAMDWFRRNRYETFLLLHILLSIATLVGCFYHTIIFEGQEYWLYLWPAVGIWAIDRFVRLIRIVYCNLHVRFNSGKGIGFTRSSASYDEAADVIRLEVVPGSSALRPTAGQYYYLYQPFRFTGWESHPFTLGSWSYETGSPSAMSRIAKNSNSIDVQQVPLLSDSSGSESQSLDIQSQEDEPELRLVFWIRPFDGWTRHLRQQCKQSPDRTLNTTILMEGPYNEEFPLWRYESVLFVAGGTGIAAVVPYIQDHVARSAATEGPTTRVQDVQLIWTTRQVAFIRQVAGRELSPALARDDFRASFYVTSPVEEDRDTRTESSALCEDEFPDKDVDVNQGRPDLQTHIFNHAQEAQLSDCSAVVLVCGPPAMADEARAAVHLAMRQGYRRIRYVEESFSW